MISAGVNFSAAVADWLEGGNTIQRPLETASAMHRMFPQNLFRSIDDPVGAVRRFRVDNPKPCHVGIVCEVKAKRFCKPQRPGIIEGAHEDSWTDAQVRQRGRSFALEAVLCAVRLENASDLYHGIQIVHHDCAQVLIKNDLVGGIDRIPQRNRSVLVLVRNADEDGITGL